MDLSRRRTRPVLLVGAALLALAACSGPVTPQELVTRLADPATPDDALADTVTPDEMGPGTARRLAELDGATFYAGTGTRDGQDVVCLVTLVHGDTLEDDAGASTCGLDTDLDDGHLRLEYGDAQTLVTATLVPDGLPTDPDLTRLTPNLAAQVTRTT
jgi:hypothetical protein